MSEIATPERDQWVEDVRQLVDEVERWAAQRGWSIHRSEKWLSESKLGRYQVPQLSILTPSGQAHVEPIARYVTDAEGRVDLYAWPSLNRMMIVRKGGRWLLKTDSGVDWPQPWSEQTLAGLVQSLTAAA